jgi:hypothetical protein
MVTARLADEGRCPALAPRTGAAKLAGADPAARGLCPVTRAAPAGTAVASAFGASSTGAASVRGPSLDGPEARGAATGTGETTIDCAPWLAVLAFRTARSPKSATKPSPAATIAARATDLPPRRREPRRTDKDDPGSVALGLVTVSRGAECA